MGRGVVVAGTPLAAAAGAEILRAGGTAIDAAVAASAVQTVVMPQMGGPGGDLFLMHSAANGHIEALMAAGAAPLAASRALYKQHGTRMPEQGILSVSVPGLVGGWFEALKRFGRLTPRQVFEPAIKFADNGYPVHKNLTRYLASAHFQSQLKIDGGLGEAFLSGRSPPTVGALLKQPQLGRTLRTLAEYGPERFYRGKLAQLFAKEIKNRRGLLTLEDLARYSPQWVDPVSVDAWGSRVYQVPPPSQGIAMLEILQIAEHLKLNQQDHNSADYVHQMVEVVKVALADRDRQICDPATHAIDVESLLSPKRASSVARRIAAGTATDAHDCAIAGSTTCIVAADTAGNAAAIVQSLGDEFGSGIYFEELGFALQNRMKGFTLEQDHPNCVAGGKLPLHTLCPSIAHRPDGSRLVLATPGGGAQPQTLAQVFLNIVCFEMDLQEAVEAPRFAYLADEIMLEKRLPSELFSLLSAKRHRVAELPEWSSVVGGCAALEIKRGGMRIAAADPRRDGYAVPE